MSIDRARVMEVAAILETARRWGEEDSSIRAIALVGSWARGTARQDSDVDLIVLSTEPGRLLRHAAWQARFGEAELVSSRDFAAIQERRLRLPSGLEVEVGIGGQSWAAADPVDAGTRRVARDGLRIVFDPDAILARLVEAVGRPGG